MGRGSPALLNSTCKPICTPCMGKSAKHISKNMSRTVQFSHNKWFVGDEEGEHLASKIAFTMDPVIGKYGSTPYVMNCKESKKHLNDNPKSI